MHQFFRTVLLGSTILLLPAAVLADWFWPLLDKVALREASADNGEDRATAPVMAPTANNVGVSPHNVHFNVGDTGYRASSRGLKANFQYGNVSAIAQFGRSGKHRLEFGSPLLPKNSKFMLSNDDNHALRFEYLIGF